MSVTFLLKRFELNSEEMVTMYIYFYTFLNWEFHQDQKESALEFRLHEEAKAENVTVCSLPPHLGGHILALTSIFPRLSSSKVLTSKTVYYTPANTEEIKLLV